MTSQKPRLVALHAKQHPTGSRKSRRRRSHDSSRNDSFALEELPHGWHLPGASLSTLLPLSTPPPLSTVQWRARAAHANRAGKVKPMVLLWALGVPIPIILLIVLLRGCF